MGKIGIEADVRKVDMGANLATIRSGKYQGIFMVGWTGDNGDPDNFFYQLLSCSAAKDGANRARWCYKPFDDLITQAKQTSDVAKRTALYGKAQLIFKAEAPWVTIAYSVIYQPIRKNVTGYKVDPFGLHLF